MGAHFDLDSPTTRSTKPVAIRVLVGISRAVPAAVFYVAGWVVGSLFYAVSKRYRRLVFSNLDLAYGDGLPRRQKRRIAHGSFVICIQEWLVLLKFVRLTSWQIEKMVQIEHEERLKNALARGNGVTLVTGHLSNFSLAMTRLVRAGCRVAVLRRKQDAEEAISYVMTLAGVRPFYHKESLLPLARFLRDGGAVLFMIDQHARRGVQVPFFGIPAATFTAPVRIAVGMNTAVLPIFIHREGWGKYVLTIEEPVELVRDRSENAVYENLLKLSGILEKYVRTYPEQWLWLHRRWRHVDRGAAEAG
jgi:KDO2-lipid IV(A) lauroyltransferase